MVGTPIRGNGLYRFLTQRQRQLACELLAQVVGHAHTRVRLLPGLQMLSRNCASANDDLAALLSGID